MPISTPMPINDLLAGRALTELALHEGVGLQDVVTGNTINTDFPKVRLANTGGAATGLIFAVGRRRGQVCFVSNEGANTVTAATAATSNVRTGTGFAILTLKSALLVWDDVGARWDAILSG